MSNHDGIGKILTRELIRAMLERAQSMNIEKMMKVFGASDAVMYDDVEETLNVAYVNREEVALAMDIFKPKVKEGTELPVIITIHGGGLFVGDRGLERPYSRFLAHRGYLVFSLEYRLAPKADLCQQLDDVCAGMDVVGRMLVDFDVDFNRIFLVADSAGAFLGAYVSAMHDSVKLQKAIGHKPSRMVLAAVGFLSGMFYTTKMLQDQIYGDKRYDKNFLKYMNTEHPEIVNNLPPAFLLTSCGDTFNNYSIKYHKALKKAGRTSKLLYFGDEELQHIFPISNPEHPKSIEGTDRMLAWFEEQAALRVMKRKPSAAVKRNLKKVEERIEDGSINEQKVWSFIKERISYDPELMSRIAVIDCTRHYTYEEMFAEWDRYARVFSGLNICSENHSRVALCGAVTAEPLFSLFALNMTGAEVSLFSFPDFLPNGMWKTMIEKEKITDLIITDVMVTSDIYEEIKEVKEKCGLRNVILMHSLMGGPAIGPAELVYNEYNYHMLKRRPDTVFMDELFEQYKDEPICYDESKGDRIAFITHTSGTTKGTRKLLPYTDKIFNETQNMFPKGLHEFVDGKDANKPLCVIQLFDFSSIMALSGQVCCPLIHGDSIVLTFFGFMHPKFIRAVDYYNVNLLFITGFMVDKWMNRTDIDDIDFSALRVVALAGGYVSPTKMELYRKFFRDHGFQYDLTAGYGMSEAGGKPMFAPKNNDRDIIGFEENPEDVRIKDENDGKYYRISDGPRTGLLYRYSDKRASNTLDGTVLFEYTEIDGKDFLCTNDLVRVNEDGSLSFGGRADKYFVNNEGRKFDSGIVDLQMATYPAISACAVVPVMDKRIHDNVPVLYVVPTNKGEHAAEEIHQAFLDAYVKDKKIPANNLVTQFVLVDEIPLNANGKLDIFRITRERLDKDAYNLIPEFDGDQLTNIRMEHVEHVNSMTAGTLPQGMENNSAYNVFDIFTGGKPTKQQESTSPFDPVKIFDMFFPSEEKEKESEKKLEIPQPLIKAILKYGNRFTSIPLGRKTYDFDFED